MSDLTIRQAKGINGEIRLRGDKSISHRAVMLASLASGRTEISGFLEGEDCLNTVRVFKALGVRIEEEEDRLVVHGQGIRGLKKPKEVLDVGNSGTTMRLLLGILAGQEFTSIITGDESLRKRPMKRVTLPLSQMGARFDGDYAPVTIYGNPHLKAISYHSPIASAQVKSAILLAGLFANGVTSVTEPVLSRDHTERMLPFFGVELKKEGLTVRLKGPASLIGGKTIHVPADISSASFFIV
ncbi:3-phosphoshikimate 1-carboxyvinyltransferase, partial [bacterium]|nr:3-phosphoshikimate 1-carboxyvinyltransferase [bacterium]